MVKITAHTIVKNEERWIWFSLMSVLNQVDSLLVFDNESTDKTGAIIKSIASPKIKYTRGKFEVASAIRNQQLQQTETDWFLVLDGDEVWNDNTIKQLKIFLAKQPKDIWGVVMRTRNCVGDVFHYQPESAGRYHLLGKTGNFNVRAYRKLPNLRWQWDYPQETYGDLENKPINYQEKHLAFFDHYYWHLTFLPRTSVQGPRKYRQISKIETGITLMDPSLLPEVFFRKHPEIVPDPLVRRSGAYELAATILTPVKEFRRKLV